MKKIFNFIVIDGPNGSGKSTIIQQVSKLLKDEFPDKEIYLTKEPTNSEIGIMAKEMSSKVNPVTLALLVAADRVEHTDQILEQTQKYDLVISDRYIFSSLILQRMDGLSFDRIMKYNDNIILPGLQIVLNGDSDIIKDRLSQRKELDRFESKIDDEIVCVEEAFIFIRRTFADIKLRKISINNDIEDGYFKNSLKVFDEIKDYLSW